MGLLVRSIDWSKTPLGPLAEWPQSLRTAMSICLNSRFPIALYWGPEFLMLYNQSLVPMVGPKKHPHAMGQPAFVVLAEIRGIIEPLLRHVRTTGEATWSEDLMLPLARTGMPEESYFTFTYSPVRDETGGVGGVFCAVVETTEKVIEERRLRLLNALAEGARAQTLAQACAHAAAEIARAPSDVPFAILYLLDKRTGVATLTGAANITAGAPLAPITIRPSDHGAWPVEDAGIKDDPRVVPLVDGPGGARGAVILPIEHSGGGERFGFVVVGLSPMLSKSASYARFHKLLAASISQGVTSAASYEEERTRAEALAELDRAKTAFFSNVSHEFRTPLTLMLGPAEDALAGADSLSAEERDRWSLVHRNALRLSRLVNTLLEFSRIEAGRVEASYEPTDLPALTGELASMFRSAIDRGGLNLSLDLHEVDEPAYVDREMWEKIVLNLLSNALKFTFEGEIAVSLQQKDEHLELVVRDTGIGIPSTELPHIFDRFHRVKGTRSRTHEGSGIGLALVAELVKLHGGSVGAESVEGGGTRIFVRVPRGHRHLPSDRIGAARSLPSTSVGVTPFLEEALRWTSPERPSRISDVASLVKAGPRARIVLADDNADMRLYLSRLLRERWDVESVSDGDAALAAIRARPPQLVLTDVMMPGLDGFDLLRAIRSDPALRLTPVILLSARAGEEATAEGLGAGANDYIVKPFSARELLVRVASTLAVAEVAREAHAIEEAARTRLYGHFMQAPLPVAVLRGPRHVVELANPIALHAWGKDESIVGKPLLDGMPELRTQPFPGYLDKVFRTGVAYRARAELARLVRSRGELEDVYFDVVYAPLRDGDGSIYGVLVCGFEVTAQVRASQELTRLLAKAEASERQFRELVENLPELAWTALPDGYVDYYNRRWYDYTGTSFEEMQGWGWKTVHDPTKLDAVVEKWQHSIESGQPFEMEFPLRGADGTFRWFLTRVTPLRDADGCIVRWFGSNTNIDERRRNEDFKEIFLGILGHDLRNPLSSILTTARVLKMRPDLPAEIHKRMDRVVVSGVRMQRMIEQLLDLTRARLAGGIPVELSATEIALSPIVSKIADEMRVAHPRAVIEVHVEDGATARMDPDRFEQVISNLLGNAILHGDSTKPIRVGIASSENGVTLTVHNWGEPISPDFLPLLFNPFARVDKAGGRPVGLGLGLYISERIVDAHKGKLTVQSSLEVGTRIEIFIPRRT